MAVITLSIEESSEQIVAGIPKTIILTTNIPSSIFYTLDGTTPTVFSNIYTGPIMLPFDVLSVTLSTFATNGVDSSPIISELYTPLVLNNTRLPHSAVDGQPHDAVPDLYPFGSMVDPNKNLYLNPGNAGETVDAPDILGSNTGYDADGYGNAFTDKNFTSENYEIVYTTTDAIGIPTVGTLPAKVIIETPPAPPEETDQFSNLFDPRALVVFQDFSKEDPEGPIHINKQFFSLENPEKARDGVSFYNSGLDSPPVNGSFLRSHYNPRDQTITYYYLDTWTNRWIISKTPYKPNGSFDGNLSGMPMANGRSNSTGGRFVYEWLTYTRRTLF